MVTTEKPKFVFKMLEANGLAVISAVNTQRDFFGRQNYDEFKKAGRKEEYIPAERCQQVDDETYAKVGEMFNVRGSLRAWRKFWDDAIVKAVSTHNNVRDTLFPEQDRRATLTTNIAWSDRRPSSILKMLTLPRRLVGEQCKYEQGLILGLGLLCAEVMSKDGDGVTSGVLSAINDFLESKLFRGRKGEPKQHHVFSYHQPSTNELVGVSESYPDPRFAAGLWVKSLDLPVRFVEDMPVLYDPREKHIESAVIKIMQRSLQATKNRETAKDRANDGVIEAEPYTGDAVGFRLVPMRGGRLFRDMLTEEMEDLFKSFDDFEDTEPDDRVDEKHGKPDRVEFRRRKIKVRRLKSPIEAIAESLEDYISEQYEVGSFDEKEGMHDGPAHPLYKLGLVSKVAPYFWPPKLTNIDLPWSLKTASYAYATNLGRKQRIDPSPFTD